MAKLDSAGKFVWVVSAGGVSYDCGYDISTDSAGNSYVTGRFSGTVTFGNTTLTTSGRRKHVFVAKLDSVGKFVWAVSAGGLAYHVGYSIAVDSLGNSYVTGSFVGTATFGDTPLVSSEGLLNSFVAKLDSSGKFVWVVPAGAGSASGISMDSSGNSYVTGDFKGTATFGSTTLTSKGSRDIFVAKLGSGGKFVWAVSGGGILDDYGGSIDVDSAGNSYVVGIFEGTATLGSTTLTSKGGFDIFVAKLDSGGKP